MVYKNDYQPVALLFFSKSQEGMQATLDQKRMNYILYSVNLYLQYKNK